MPDIHVSTIRHLLLCNNCLFMYDVFFISLILYAEITSCMPNQTTKQQTMVLTRTTKGSSDCSVFDNVTPLPFYF